MELTHLEAGGIPSLCVCKGWEGGNECAGHGGTRVRAGVSGKAKAGGPGVSGKAEAREAGAGVSGKAEARGPRAVRRPLSVVMNRAWRGSSRRAPARLSRALWSPIAKGSHPPVPRVYLGGKREGEGFWLLMSSALPRVPASNVSFF